MATIKHTDITWERNPNGSWTATALLPSWDGGYFAHRTYYGCNKAEREQMAYTDFNGEAGI